MYFLPELKKEPGLIHAVSDVSDGNMAFSRGEAKEVSQDRLRFFEKLNIDPKKIVPMDIDHEDLAVRVDGTFETDLISDKDYRAIKADALFTNKKGIFLFVLTGDCLPITFYAPKSGVLALAHLSWMNTKKDFSSALIKKLEEEYGVHPADLKVAIGPAIHKESYIFPKEVVVQRGLSAWGKFLEKAGNGISVDIIGYNRDKLVSAGVKDENIEISAVDTGRDMGFFSHYRSRRTGEPEGRMITIVGMA